MPKKLILGSAFYSTSSMLTAILYLLYQFIMMFFLDIDDYGIIQPLLQFVGLLILPINAFQFSLTKYFSSMSNNTLHLEGQFFVRILTTIAIIIFILWSLLIPVFQSIFHTNNLSILVLLGVSLALQIIPIPYTSLLQAENRFFSAGMIQIVHSVIRVIAGWVILSQSSTMIGAMLGIIISNIVFLLGSGYPYINSVISNLLSQESISYKIKNFPYKVLWISLGSVGLFSLLVYSDSVLVRSLLPNESALFSSASLFGKGSIFLATAISFIVLPLMSKKTHDSKIALWYGCIFLLVLVIMYCVFFWITAPLIAKILFKNEITIAIRFQKRSEERRVGERV